MSSSRHTNDLLSRQAPRERSANLDLEQAIVDSSVVDPKKRVYLIGNFSPRINFFAQQTRALNLVWSLLKLKKFGVHDRIAVIGGGLAGMTAAVALLQKGLQVEVFEQYG